MAPLAVGDIIVVGKNVQETGTVKFIGETEFQAGEWVGIELEGPQGKNDGTVKGVKYFDCKPNHGIFVRPAAVTKKELAGGATKKEPAKPDSPKAEEAKRDSVKPDVAKASTKAATAKARGSALQHPKQDSGKPPMKARASVQSVQTPAKSEPPPVKARSSVPATKAPAVSAKARASVQPGVPAKAAGPPSPGSPDANKKAEHAKAPSPKAEAPPKAAPKAEAAKAEAASKAAAAGAAAAKEPAVAAEPTKDAAPEDADAPPAAPPSRVLKKTATFKEDHEEHPVECRLTAEALSKRDGGGGGESLRRKMSFSTHRSSVATSAAGLEDIIASAECGANFTITGPDGEEVSVEELIQLFEESREELEGVQEMLDEAQTRENELRREVERLKAGSAGKADGLARSKTLTRAVTNVGLSGGDVFDNILMLTESHKVTHHLQCPPGTESVYAYFECQGGTIKDVCFFGLQYYLKKYLVGPVVTSERIDMAEMQLKEHFSHPFCTYKEEFFNRDAWEYILENHAGHLPVEIKAVPEGTVLPYKNVLFTVESTDQKCFWLTAYLEALLMQVWYPTAVCTQRLELKRTIMRYLKETGSDELLKEGKHALKLHDFGFRAVSSVESAAIGSAAHLVHFRGSDTLPALMLAKGYYCDTAAGLSGVSVDQSTIATWGTGKVEDAVRNILGQSPVGLLTCMSDSQDILASCENCWGTALKPVIEQRDGVVFIGVDIAQQSNLALQVLEKLECKFGSSKTTTGHKLLPPYVRVMQLDGIDCKTAENTLQTLRDSGWAADNIAFGCTGSSLQKVHCDTQKCALRCSLVRVQGQDVEIVAGKLGEQTKQPKSGRMTLEFVDNTWKTVDKGSGQADRDKLVTVFRNGKLLVDDALQAIRSRSDGLQIAPAAARPDRTGRPPAPPPRKEARRQLAGSQLRQKMGNVKAQALELKEKAAMLRQAKPRQADAAEKANSALEADIDCFAKVYTINGGNPERIAEECGGAVSLELLKKQPPTDARDFAKRLLEGCYTGDTSALAKRNLRERLLEDLQSKARNLKKTEVKTAAGPDIADLESVGRIFTENGGDLNKIAATCGLPLELLNKFKPVDATDFAKKLFEGVFTGDTSEMAKVELRQRLLADLQEKAQNLKKAPVKESSAGPTAADLEKVGQIFTENGGDLNKIAAACDLHIELLNKFKPVDATDFAKKLFEGVFSGDTSEMAKLDLRQRLLADLQEKAQQLKKTPTKESRGSPTDADLECIAKMYTECIGAQDDAGPHQRLLEIFGADPELLRKNAPSDGTDFAKKLLEGVYTGDSSELAKSQFRQRLLEDLQESAAKLKKTRVKKKGPAAPSTSDIDCIAQIYTDNEGDLAKVAAATGANLELLKKSPPENAVDFAKKLFDGVYTGDVDELAKQNLRDRLLQDLQKQAQNLKKMTPKESPMGPSEDDIACVAQVYTDNGGDLDKLAALCGANVDLLRTNKPLNAQDFARKLLEGVYSGCQDEINKKGFRERLLEDLQAKANSLRKTEVKEAALGPSESDIKFFVQLFDEKKGDLGELAAIVGAHPNLLEKNRPANAHDFATKLLNGLYSGDNDAIAAKSFRDKLLMDLQAKAGNLKKSEIKVASTAPSSADIDCIAKLYTDNSGDLDRIAAICGANVELLHKNRPSDAKDFAVRLLQGTYSGDGSTEISGDLRERFLADLRSKSVKLRRVETKEGLGAPSIAEVECIARIYSENDGDLSKIAMVCGVTEALLRKAPPTDANDFANKLLLGLYTSDITELAKSTMRERLLVDLQAKASTLRKAETKAFGGTTSAADIECIGKVFNDHGGDHDKLAAAFGISRDLLKKSPPTSGEDFAKKVLSGLYTVDSHELAKKGLRDRLLADLLEKSEKLKKTEIKEAPTGPSEDDVAIIAKLYTANDGCLEKIAESCGANLSLLRKNPPTDAADFARKLLEGMYTGDESSLAKAQLRDRLLEDLQAGAKKLRKIEVKEAGGEISETDAEIVAKIYTDNNGDLAKIAEVCGLQLSLLENLPPQSALDFGCKLLEGVYTADANELAKCNFRDRLLADLQAKTQSLRKAEIKESSSGPSAEDIACVAKLYAEASGDLRKMAEVCGVSFELLESSKPANAEEFAKKLLEGAYTGDSAELAKKSFRDRLLEDLKSKASELKKVEVKEGLPEATEAEIASVATLYTSHDGNLDSLATAIGANVWLLKKSPPVDAKDFAKKLLQGLYTGDSTEMAKVEFRDRLLENLQAKAINLKPTQTREKTAPEHAAMASDVDCIARVYSRCDGDHGKLAELCGADPELIKRNPPTSSQDFATKLLEGMYTGDTSELAKSRFRDRLLEDLQAKSRTLKPVKQHERRSLAVKELRAPDVEQIAHMYDKHQGDLDAIAEVCGLAPAWLKKNKPKDGEDFAHKLLEGLYSGDMGALQKAELRDRLRQDLVAQASQLKKTPAPKEKPAAVQADPKDIALMASLWGQHAGDLQKLADACGINLELLRKNPPANGEAFAKNLLEGVYTGDSSDVARKMLKDRLLQDLQAKATSLKKIEVKDVSPAGPLVADIDCLAKVYAENSGDLDRLAAVCAASADLLRKYPPADGQDFAKKLLEGVYTGDASQDAKLNLRNRLMADLQAKAVILKKTEITAASQGPSAADLESASKIYTECGGDLERIAARLGGHVTMDLLKKNQPTDAREFALKLLEGQYTGDDSEMAKANLRDRLLEDLQARAKTLKRTQTKECAGGASASDIQFIAKLYTDHGGDIEKFSAQCGVKLVKDLLSKAPPKDANDFAKKLLEGTYTGETDELAKKGFRDNLRLELQAKLPSLRRTETKQAIVTASDEDINAMATMYAKCDGDLERLAEISGASLELLRRAPPLDAATFAKKLLAGDYAKNVVTG